jgi:hypothetical protein
MYGPARFWMPAGKSTQLLFLDDTVFSILEHQVQIEGDWRNWFTCLRDLPNMDEIVCCQKLGSKSASMVGYYSVADLSSWADQQGNVRQYELKLFPAKVETLERLKTKSESRQGKGLAGCIYKATRLTDRSPGTGDEFEFVKEADMGEFFKHATYRGKKLSSLVEAANSKGAEEVARLSRIFQVSLEGGKILPKVVPFNYEFVLAPRTPAELKVALASYTPSFGAGAANGSTTPALPDQHEVPF